MAEGAGGGSVIEDGRFRRQRRGGVAVTRLQPSAPCANCIKWQAKFWVRLPRDVFYAAVRLAPSSLLLLPFCPGILRCLSSAVEFSGMCGGASGRVWGEMVEKCDLLSELLLRVDATRCGLVEASQLRQALARACGVALSDRWVA